MIEYSTIFEDLSPMASKRALLIIGRYQPPTNGHYEVFNAGKKYIRQHPELKLEASPVVVVIGGSDSDSDKKRNPLTVQEREQFMKASGRANGVIFLTAENAFKAFQVARDSGFEPIIIAAGSDRVQEYKNILDNYFTTLDGKHITHHTITLTRDVDAIENKKEEKSEAIDSALNHLKNGGNLEIKQISGSLARRAVELGYEPEFIKIVGLEHKPKLAKQMFDKIKVAIS